MDLTTNNRSPDKRQKLDDQELAADQCDQSSDWKEPAQKTALDLRSALLIPGEAAVEEAGLSINLLDSVKLGAITLKRPLRIDPQAKLAAIEGEYNNEKAVVVLEKTPFSEDNLSVLFSEATDDDKPLERDFVNDIYGHYWLSPASELNSIKTTIIHPATDKHIEKFLPQEFHILEETPEKYQEITLPFINSSQFDMSWVINILDHKKETERIVFEDPDPEVGFVLLPDSKWDRKQLSNLYLVAIVHKRDIKSLRDLKEEHLPLLKNIKEKGTKAIVAEYGLAASQLRIYFHYQPSYYHLHIHFTSMEFEAPGSRVERAHLLESVINNITLCGDYYQRATLCFPEKKQSKLYDALTKN
ncbi:m7GpppX diphosphatase [Halotydeus destructor]|nr:m7GpppX diphosphatase [Halotydeus destructor]